MKTFAMVLSITLMALYSSCATARPQEPMVWAHHSTQWWTWWWSKNCQGKSPLPVGGLLSTLTFNYNKQEYDEAMKEIETVVTQARNSGFLVIPTLNIHIHRGYEAGQEFNSWFDRNAWAERAKWLEGMVPYAHENTLGVDIEPYWEWESSPRYPKFADSEQLAYAIQPFIDVLVKNKIRLYVFPADDTAPWLQIVAKGGVELVLLFENSYWLSDFYQTNETAYQKRLASMAVQKKELEPAGLKYVPGFFETALKKPGFLKTMSDLGYKETWVFLRRDPDVHKYNKFCLPEFYDLEPYKVEKKKSDPEAK